MPPTGPFAHSLPDRPQTEWEPLEVHLRAVAELAAQFAASFGASPWAETLGLWHDLGKYSKEFQSYLGVPGNVDANIEQLQGRVDHSTAGAQHAVRSYTDKTTPVGRILAFCIAGHHSGLLDTSSNGACLDERLKKVVHDWKSAGAELLTARPLKLPAIPFASNANRLAFQIGLFVRMLFSTLVDADFLATESFMDKQRAGLRPKVDTDFFAMDRELSKTLERLSTTESSVNKSRQEILTSCISAAELPPGLFSLTVPTGGGKTLASLAFALRHALKHSDHGFRRIVFAIPFTSIIEQTADVYRKVFDVLEPNVVLEHHSNLDPERETATSRLASENWDAPLVVTTNVQLFESLFAAQTSRCRKLHRLTRSIIILDEAQTIPVNLLQPCLAILRELVECYGVTIVLCTATQPAVIARDGFAIGLAGVREIIPNPRELYKRMRRVEVLQIGKQTDGELVERIAAERQSLTIVNTRKHAADLYRKLCDSLPEKQRKSVFHLSTMMCGTHRSEFLTRIKNRLAEGRSVRVVSTSLIEAGVDADFPTVFRALIGLDSIAQAAGRCNREGKAARGTVYVFEPADVKLHGYQKATAESTAELLPAFADLLSLEAVERYFALHYWRHKDRWDHKQIMPMFGSGSAVAMKFRTISDSFRMIDDHSMPVIVGWGERGQKIVEHLTNDRAIDRDFVRRLQRYTVNVPISTYQKLMDVDVTMVKERFAVLTNKACYDERLGLCMDRSGQFDPESLFVGGI